MATEDAVNHVQGIANWLGHDTSFLKGKDRSDAISVASSLDQMQDFRSEETLRLARGCHAPVLMMYMSDGWSVGMGKAHTVWGRMADREESRANEAGVSVRTCMLLIISVSGKTTLTIKVFPPAPANRTTGCLMYRLRFAQAS